MLHKDIKESNKSIIFPRYLELAELTTDQFWKDFFYACAMNKKTRHLLLNGNTVTTYDVRYKKTIIKLPKDNTEALKIFQNLMKSELELFSEKDVKNQEDIFNRTHETYKLEFSDWKQISHQRTKDNLLVNYCIRFAEENQQSILKRSKHFQLIKYALSFKHIKNTNIIISNSQIAHITGISLNPLTKLCTLDNMVSSDKNASWSEKKTKKIADEMNNYYKQRVKHIKI